jgi:hypothetical protein
VSPHTIAARSAPRIATADRQETEVTSGAAVAPCAPGLSVERDIDAIDDRRVR